MLQYLDAEKIANDFIYKVTNGIGVMMPEYTIEKKYGWIFFFQSKKFLETDDFSFILAGNAPFLVDHSGQIHVTGTAYRISHYIEIFDKQFEM